MKHSIPKVWKDCFGKLSKLFLFIPEKTFEQPFAKKAVFVVEKSIKALRGMDLSRCIFDLSGA